MYESFESPAGIVHWRHRILTRILKIKWSGGFFGQVKGKVPHFRGRIGTRRGPAGLVIGNKYPPLYFVRKSNNIIWLFFSSLDAADSMILDVLRIFSPERSSMGCWMQEFIRSCTAHAMIGKLGKTRLTTLREFDLNTSVNCWSWRYLILAYLC